MTDPDLPTVAVVIPTAGQRPATLDRLISAVLRDPATSEVIAVLDHRSPATEAVVARNDDPRVRLVRTCPPITPERDRGQASRDVGFRHARSEVLLSLDDDVEPAEGLVTGHGRWHSGRTGLVVRGYTPVVPADAASGDSAAATRYYAKAYERACEFSAVTRATHSWICGEGISQCAGRTGSGPRSTLESRTPDPSEQRRGTSIRRLTEATVNTALTVYSTGASSHPIDIGENSVESSVMVSAPATPGCASTSYIRSSPGRPKSTSPNEHDCVRLSRSCNPDAPAPSQSTWYFWARVSVRGRGPMRLSWLEFARSPCWGSRGGSQRPGEIWQRERDSRDCAGARGQANRRPRASAAAPSARRDNARAAPAHSSRTCSQAWRRADNEPERIGAGVVEDLAHRLRLDQQAVARREGEQVVLDPDPARSAAAPCSSMLRCTPVEADAVFAASRARPSPCSRRGRTSTPYTRAPRVPVAGTRTRTWSADRTRGTSRNVRRPVRGC